jgi:hypothetical protein
LTQLFECDIGYDYEKVVFVVVIVQYAVAMVPRQENPTSKEGYKTFSKRAPSRWKKKAANEGMFLVASGREGKREEDIEGAELFIVI